MSARPTAHLALLTPNTNATMIEAAPPDENMVYPETEICAVAQAMSDRSIDVMPVSDGTAIIGAVSSADILRHVANGAHSTLVGSIMQFDVERTSTNPPLGDASEAEPVTATMPRAAGERRDTLFAFVEDHSYSYEANEDGDRIVRARLFGHGEHVELLLKPGHAAVTYYPNDFVIAEGVRRTHANGTVAFEAEAIARVASPRSYKGELA